MTTGSEPDLPVPPAQGVPARVSPLTAPSSALAPTRASLAALLVPLLAGGAVAVALGVYGKLHTPSGVAVNVAGFSSPQTVKVWLATGAFLLAVVQLLSALAMWGKLGGFSPSWAGTAHRWSGRVAFLLTVPVAVHCLYALGFATYDLRTLAHSLLGCLFYGAFVAKMLLLPRRRLPGWTLPVVGGLVFTALTCLFLTSSVWYFTTFGVRL